MARYIDADKFISWVDTEHLRPADEVCLSENNVVEMINLQPTADVVEVVKCGKCQFAEELEPHCELDRKIYKHCVLWRGDETKNVWHKYKKYYRDYSLVAIDEFCSEGLRTDKKGVAE